MVDSDEAQEFREQFYQYKKGVNGVRNGVFSVLNDSN